MKQHTAKLIAPVVIIAIIVTYYALLGWLVTIMPIPVWGKILAILIPAALIGIAIYVLIQRIKEIRSGEEDDLGQY